MIKKIICNAPLEHPVTFKNQMSNHQPHQPLDTGCSLIIVFFSLNTRKFASSPLRQHSAAIGCTKNYQPLGVTVHSYSVESLEWIVEKHIFSWTPCKYIVCTRNIVIYPYVSTDRWSSSSSPSATASAPAAAFAPAAAAATPMQFADTSLLTKAISSMQLNAVSIKLPQLSCQESQLTYLSEFTQGHLLSSWRGERGPPRPSCLAPADLPLFLKAEFVFVQRDCGKPPLSPLYDCPNRVLHWVTAYFCLAIGRQEDNILVSPLKLVLSADTIQPSLPCRRG